MKEYYGKNGNLDIPKDYTREDGYRLGEWLYGHQRQMKKRNK